MEDAGEDYVKPCSRRRNEDQFAIQKTHRGKGSAHVWGRKEAGRGLGDGKAELVELRVVVLFRCGL